MPKNWPFYRKILSIGANTVVRFITGRFSLHDWTGGYRAYRKEVFLKERDKLRSYSGYTFQVAALYKSLLDGYKVGEVPIHFYSRKVGDSKIAPAEYIVSLFKYVITERVNEVLRGPFGKFLVVGGLGFLINAILYDLLVRHTHLPIAVANLVAAQFSIFSNFNLNNIWTFNSRKSKSWGAYFLKMLQFYLTSNTGVFFIQTGTIFIGDMLFGEQLYRLYFVIGTFFLLIWNFTLYNKVIWRKKTPAPTV